MNCPKCGNVIRGACCGTCGFDLKRNNLVYIGTAASQELSALAAFIDEKGKQDRSFWEEMLEQEPEEEPGTAAGDSSSEDTRKKNAETFHLDHVADKSLKKTLIWLLCSCLLLGLSWILQKLDWGELRKPLIYLSSALQFATIITALFIPTHISNKYQDLRSELDKNSVDDFSFIITLIYFLILVIAILAGISQLVCKIVSWDSGRVFFNHVWTHLVSVILVLSFIDEIVTYLMRLSARKYSWAQCALWAVVAAILCFSIAVFYDMQIMSGMRITAEDISSESTTSGLPQDSDEDKTTTGEKEAYYTTSRAFEWHNLSIWQNN